MSAEELQAPEVRCRMGYELPLYARLVRSRRVAMGWTQAMLAKKCGVTQPYIAKIERGRHHPSVRMIRVLKPVLGIKYSELVEQIANPSG